MRTRGVEGVMDLELESENKRLWIYVQAVIAKHNRTECWRPSKKNIHTYTTTFLYNMRVFETIVINGKSEKKGSFPVFLPYDCVRLHRVRV